MHTDCVPPPIGGVERLTITHAVSVNYVNHNNPGN